MELRKICPITLTSVAMELLLIYHSTVIHVMELLRICLVTVTHVPCHLSAVHLGYFLQRMNLRRE